MPCDRIDYKHLGSNDQRGFLHRTWTCVTFAVQVSRLFFPLLQDWHAKCKECSDRFGAKFFYRFGSDKKSYAIKQQKYDSTLLCRHRQCLHPQHVVLLIQIKHFSVMLIHKTVLAEKDFSNNIPGAISR